MTASRSQRFSLKNFPAKGNENAPYSDKAAYSGGVLVKLESAFSTDVAVQLVPKLVERMFSAFHDRNFPSARSITRQKPVQRTPVCPSDATASGHSARYTQSVESWLSGQIESVIHQNRKKQKRNENIEGEVAAEIASLET